MIVTYFIADSYGYVKIGQSDAPRARMKVLQIGHACPLQLLGVTEFREKQAHHKWASLRVSGEWFHLTSSLAAWIEFVSQPEYELTSKPVERRKIVRKKDMDRKIEADAWVEFQRRKAEGREEYFSTGPTTGHGHEVSQPHR